MPSEVNRTPVDKADLLWRPEFGIPYYAPKGCISCGALAKRACAEAVGLAVVPFVNAVGNDDERCLPMFKEYRAHDEMKRRVDGAVDGSCRFVESNECWRNEGENNNG